MFWVKQVLAKSSSKMTKKQFYLSSEIRSSDWFDHEVFVFHDLFLHSSLLLIYQGAVISVYTGGTGHTQKDTTSKPEVVPIPDREAVNESILEDHTEEHESVQRAAAIQAKSKILAHSV
uniref:Uncharacterized protein n=1 Tax=Amphimedon queenslandica TaxID=400682 RepID=A0A1X7VCC4_AMPQE